MPSECPDDTGDMGIAEWLPATWLPCDLSAECMHLVTPLPYSLSAELIVMQALTMPEQSWMHSGKHDGRSSPRRKLQH